jgi:prolyl-tRNA synthetase
MLQSNLFSKTSKEAPKDEPSANARLLEQAGYIKKTLAGVYTFLPLGNRVLRKIENIVRKHMDKISAELLLPSLQPKENWVKTGRWQEMDVLFKLQSQYGYEYALGPTHEEIIAPLSANIISSYRDLPITAYQIQTKFRDEARAKSGLLRGREFRMKDLYSFHRNQEDLDKYYEKVQQSYQAIFEELGLRAILTEASGGSFSKYSHEYQVLTEAGEDQIFVCEKCGLAKNKEIYSGDDEKCTKCGKTTWKEEMACEVGNIFKLGTKFTKAFEISYLDEEGKPQIPLMGCYGIGTTRLMGVIAELYHDEKGLAWPAAVAPFYVHILPLSAKDASVQEAIEKQAEILCEQLADAGFEALIDNRQETAGSKFNDADLLGIPLRAVISEKTLAQKSYELKPHSVGSVGDSVIVPYAEVLDFIKKK